MRQEEDGPEQREIAPDDLPGQTQSALDYDNESSSHDAAPPPSPSLSDDLKAFIEDGKTYAEAELAFQKSRAAFAGNRAKSIAFYGILAFGFLHLTLVALVVGSVFALAQAVNPWLATAIVIAVLVCAIVILGFMIRAKTRDVISAFGNNSGQDGEDAS